MVPVPVSLLIFRFAGSVGREPFSGTIALGSTSKTMRAVFQIIDFYL